MNALPLVSVVSLLCYLIPIKHHQPSINSLIAKHSNAKAIPIALIQSIIKHESNFNPKATRYEPKLKSHSMGLMQIMANYWVASTTCPFINKPSDLLEPDLNLKCGTAILSGLLEQYPSTKDALIAYNGGSGCFKSSKCMKQSSAYARKILS